MAFTENMADFMDVDTGFAVNAVYDGSTQITGIYGAEPTDAFSIGAMRPTFLVAAADIDADPRGKALTIDSSSFIVREFDLDLTGTLATLKLEVV
jgi:hypothetical protein